MQPDVTPEGPSTANPPAKHVADQRDHDVLFRLLDNCVTAMQMLEKRMVEVETKARRAVEETARERSETRADIATLRTRTKLSNSNIDQMQARVAAFETGVCDATARQAREAVAARAEAENWRQRAETGIKAIAAMESRLTQVEGGLERRLIETESTLAQTRSHAAAFEQRAEVSEARAADLESRLSDAAAAVADQRARIACLQAKLGATQQASRYADDAIALSDASDEATGGIIDLKAHTDDRRISAA